MTSGLRLDGHTLPEGDVVLESPEAGRRVRVGPGAVLGDPVDDALVLHLIELALKAPTGSNAQNWEFVVVKDVAVKARAPFQFAPSTMPMADSSSSA